MTELEELLEQIEPNDEDNVKSIRLKLVDFERSESKEDLRDIWQDTLRELSSVEDLELNSEHISSLINEPSRDEIKMSDLYKALRMTLAEYEANKIMGQERNMNIHFGAVIQILSCISEDFDYNEENLTDDITEVV